MNNDGVLLPNLSGLKMDKVVPTEAGKRKREEGNDDHEIMYFKAHMQQPEVYRLSNLFGPVEWAFQRSKFREGSAVYNFLLQGEKLVWTEEWFAEVCKGMGFPLSTPKSYIKSEGEIATGLLATFTKVIVTNPTGATAKKRLKYILEYMNAPELQEKNDKGKFVLDAEKWKKDNVLPNTTADEKVELMRTLLKQKFTADLNNIYTQALLNSGDKELREQGRAGKGSLWEYGKLSEPLLGVTNDNPNRLSNQLGMLLMERREELRAEMASAVLVPLEPPASNDKEIV